MKKLAQGFSGFSILLLGFAVNGQCETVTKIASFHQNYTASFQYTAAEQPKLVSKSVELVLGEADSSDPHSYCVLHTSLEIGQIKLDVLSANGEKIGTTSAPLTSTNYYQYAPVDERKCMDVPPHSMNASIFLSNSIEVALNQAGTKTIVSFELLGKGVPVLWQEADQSFQWLNVQGFQMDRARYSMGEKRGDLELFTPQAFRSQQEAKPAYFSTEDIRD